MPDEEKKAIELLEELNWSYFDMSESASIPYLQARDTVLNLIQKQQAEIEKKDNVIDEIQKEVRNHIGFENRLKRDNREPDLFNQGRFYVANNIIDILKMK